MRVVIRILVSAAALFVATLAISGIELTTGSTESKVLTLLVVALIFGVVNTVLKPIVKVIGCVFYVLTLGLIALVVNALLLLLTSWVAEKLSLPFHITGFWPAFWGAILIGVVSWLLNLLLGDRKPEKQLLTCGRCRIYDGGVPTPTTPRPAARRPRFSFRRISQPGTSRSGTSRSGTSRSGTSGPGTSGHRAGWRLMAPVTAGLTLASGLTLAAPGSAASAAPGSPARGAPAAHRTIRHPQATGHPQHIRLGRLALHRCASVPLTYCGRVRVPLDYSSAASPDIGLGFRWLPATAARHPAGTILTVEGGPGFASTGTEPEYVAMTGPLLRSRNLLIIDLRGTGTSTPLDCPGLEDYGRTQHQDGRAFDRLVAACGVRLNHTWRYRGGGWKHRWVHASDLFNTADSARDVSGVLHAAHLRRVDLYGDSYGSWFAQVFASRYPAQLRSVTLDSTYQVLGLDPWYTTTVVTARRAFNQACRRSAACTAAAGHASAWSRIAALARRLARSPVSGRTTTENGTAGRITVTALTLVNLVNNAGFDPVVYRNLDAAGRALLRHGDAAPLLRLAALSLGFDDPNYPLPEFSDALYFAVSCTDYVQLFGRDEPPAARARQYRAAVRREPRRVFAPFSIGQWTSLDQYTEAYSACLDWPSPVYRSRPITRRPPLVPARLPVLILSGTLDSLTPRLHGATLVARQMGRSARLVTFANLTHVMLQDADDSCPAAVYRRFVRRPGNLHRLNVSCARRVAPVHTVGSYPLRLADAVPATPARGNTAGRLARQAASVALATVGDEISRWPLLGGDRDRGLRGGQVRFSGGNVLRISLSRARWVTDAVTDGTAWWNQSSGRVTARLVVYPATGPPVRLTARWRPYGQQDQLAVITGSRGSRPLAAVMPAP